MSDAIVSRLGQIDASGDAKALFLKKFAGEILTTFAERNVMLPITTVRTIDSGKSAQFPATGVSTAAYHVPGNELLGSSIKHAERVISIDSLLVAHTFIANIDEAMNHYDVRSEYSKKLAEALSNKADRNLLQVTVLAARASSTVSGGNGGSRVTNVNASNADEMAAAFFDAAQAMDEKEVWDGERNAVVRPAQYYLLVQNQSAINRDWGGSGSYANGTIMNIAGIDIRKSNHIPSVNVSNDSDNESNTYGGSFDEVNFVVLQKQAVGTVKLLDLAVESEYQISRQGTLMVAKYAMGHGILRPECAVEVCSGS